MGQRGVQVTRQEDVALGSLASPGDLEESDSHHSSILALHQPKLDLVAEVNVLCRPPMLDFSKMEALRRMHAERVRNTLRTQILIKDQYMRYK